MAVSGGCANFSGIIVYKKSYVLKNNNTSLERLTESRGNIAVYYIKDNNYKWVVKNDETLIGEYIYRGDENKNYNISHISGTCSISDYSRDNCELISHHYLLEPANINDQLTDVFVYKRSGSSDTLFLSRNHSLDPKKFTKHIAYCYNQVTNLTHGKVPIRKVHESGSYITYYDAVSIKKVKLSKSDFINSYTNTD